MSSFNSTTIGALVVGAIVLGAGIYYESYASKRLEEARMALRSVEGAQSRAETTRERGEQYVSLIADMEDRKIDHQEPLAVASEFSPQEISELGSLLDTLYQRDGHFFLERFELAWRDGNYELGLLPRVALDLEGRKVLLFSDDAASVSAVSYTKR